MDKLWSISDVAKLVNVSNKTIINQAKKHKIISLADKQGKTYWLTNLQVERLIYLCYPKSHGLVYAPIGEHMKQHRPIPTSIGKITYVTYKDKRYYRIVKFPLSYTDDGAYAYYKTQSFDTKEEAVAYREQLIDRRNKGEFQSLYTFVSFYDIIVDIFSHRAYKKNTRHNIENALNKHFKPCFESIPLEDVNRDMLQRFLDKLTHSTGTCQFILMTVLKELWLDDKLPKDYRSQLRLPKKQQSKQKRALTKEELHTYFNLVEKKPFAFIAKLMFLTGLRVNEALALKWSDFQHLDNGLTIVNVDKTLTYINGTTTESTPKTTSSIRKVYFNDIELQQQLKDKQSSSSSQYIAFNPKTNTRMNYHSFSTTYFENIGRKMGIRLTSHYARVTYASYALEGGMSLKNLQQQMGHSNSIMLHTLYAKPVYSIIDDVSTKKLYH